MSSEESVEYLMSRLSQAVHTALKEEGIIKDQPVGFLLGLETGEGFQTFGNLTREETINFLVTGLQNMTGKQVLLVTRGPSPKHAVRH